MIICEVIGNIWATRKEEGLSGLKLMVVRQLNSDMSPTEGVDFIAADAIGAGAGEFVLVAQGSSARKAIGNDSIPIDAVIVGIIDSLEVEKARRAVKEG